MARWPYRNGLRVSAAAVLVLASLTACTSHRITGTGGLGPVTAPVSSSPSAGPTVLPTPGTTTPGTQPTATSTSTKKSKPSSSPTIQAKVSVTVGDVDSVTTTVCPHHFAFTGNISVDRGPTDVVYSWKRNDGTTTSQQTLHFPGTGSQTMTVTDDYPATLANGEVIDTIDVVGPFTVSAGIRHGVLQCTGSATTPLAVPRFTCPNLLLTSSITVPIGGQTVNYAWHFSNGMTDRTGTYVFAPGVTQRTIGTSLNLNGTVKVSVQITNGAGMTTDQKTVTCP